MGLLGKLWGKVTGPKREDSVFGSMVFMGGYWEGQALFPPEEQRIEVFVDGERDDDLSVQHAFYQTLCEKWPQLSATLEPLVKKEWDKHLVEWEEPNPGSEIFKVTSVQILRAALPVADWQITFSPVSRPTALIEIAMKGTSPGDVEVDDDN